MLSAAGTTFSVVVNNTDPVWVSCQVPGRCEAGMASATNPAKPGNKTYDHFLAMAQGKANVGTGSSSKSAAAAMLASFELSGMNGAEIVSVSVGSGGLAFGPQTVAAAAGDIITFTFAGTHTATQVAFDTPCSPLSGGFDSGTLGPGQTFSVRVNDTDPIWISCQVPNHCKAGMVFAINAPSSGDNTFKIFQSNAEGKSGSPSTTSPPASSTQGSMTTSAPATSSAGTPKIPGLPPLAIGGISGGSALFILVAVVILHMCATTAVTSLDVGSASSSAVSALLLGMLSVLCFAYLASFD
ncbi:hypothetical protein DL93DRAFT_2164605 [Clavulina sp. PMI_390]|nr:hypothetical protein DL93DRAFT_2164605 [Clavulina sp. PMI_390]